MEQKSFVFRSEWKRILSRLPKQVRLEVYEAIVEYGISGTLPSLKAMAGLAFDLIKEDMDEDAKKERELNEKRKNAASKRWKKENAEGDAKHANVSFASKNDANNANASFASDKESTPSSPPIENTPTPLREYNPLIIPPKEKGRKNFGKKNEELLFPNIPGGYEDFDFSYVEEHLAEPFFGFIQYRKERKDKKFTPTGLKTTYKHLKEFSHNDPAVAKLVVEQTIANNWQGLFPLKTNENGTDRRTGQTAAERTADAARNIADFILDN